MFSWSLAVFATACLVAAPPSLVPPGWSLVRAKCVVTDTSGSLNSSRMTADKVYVGDKSLLGNMFTVRYKADFLFSMLHDDAVVFGSALKPGEAGLFWVRPRSVAGEVEAVNDYRELTREVPELYSSFPHIFGRSMQFGTTAEMDRGRTELAEFIEKLGAMVPGDELNKTIRLKLNVFQPAVVSSWAALSMAKVKGPAARAELVSALRARRMPVFTRLTADAALISIDARWRDASERYRYLERVFMFADTPEEIRATLSRFRLGKSGPALDFTRRFLASDDMDSGVHRDAVLGFFTYLPDQATTATELAEINTLILELRGSSPHEDVRQAAEAALRASTKRPKLPSP